MLKPGSRIRPRALPFLVGTALLVFLLPACGGGGGGSSSSGGGGVVLPRKTLTWNSITQYTDGSTIPNWSSKLGYEIYLKGNPTMDNYVVFSDADSVASVPPSQTSFDLNALASPPFSLNLRIGINYAVCVKAVDYNTNPPTKSAPSPQADFQF